MDGESTEFPMRTREALWMANRDGEAAIALAPLGAAPSALTLSGPDALLALSDGGTVRIPGADAADIVRIAVDAGTVSIFELDAAGGVRRSTRVGVSA